MSKGIVVRGSAWLDRVQPVCCPPGLGVNREAGRAARGWSVGPETGCTLARGRSDDGVGDLALSACGGGLGERAVILTAPPVAVSPSPRKRTEGEERRHPHMPSLQNQKGAGVSASPPVSPSACWPIRETGALRGRQTVFRFRQGSAGPCVPTVAMRPLAGHRDGTAPKSRDPASMSLRSRPALRRSGIAVRSSIDTIPEGSSHSITSRRFLCPKALVPSRLWLQRRGHTRRRCRSVTTRSTRSEDGLCVQGVRPGVLPEGIGPCPFACHPPHWASDAIGRLSVPFAHGRCDHRPCGFPGWRPRPDRCGFPKAPASARP